MYLFWDITYILVIIGAVITLLASIYMQNVYKKYGNIENKAGITGAQFAKLMLDKKGITDVIIRPIRGHLTDNYNPANNTLSLSQTTFAANTIGAVGVAGHEAGHAMQHHVKYWAFRARAWLVPITNFGAKLSWPMIFIGMIFGWNQTLIDIGIVLFAFVFVFHMITLPVEINASRRSISTITDLKVLSKDELTATKKILRAAALTYVAAAASTLLQLLRLILRFGNRRDEY